MPYLFALFLVCLTVRTGTSEFTLQNVFEPELVFVAIEFCVVLVQRIICQMHKHILEILIVIVLFGGQPDQAVVVEEYGHRTDYGSDEHVDSEVIFVPLVQSRPFNVLLHDIKIIWSDLVLRLRHIFLLLLLC